PLRLRDERHEAEHLHPAVRCIERDSGVFFVASRQRLRLRHRVAVSFDVAKPTSQEQQALWKSAGVNGQIEALATQFNLSTESIHAATAQSKSPEELWNACRAQARPRLD